MKRSTHRTSPFSLAGLLLAGAALLALLIAAIELRAPLQTALFNLTGEEKLAPQLKGLSDLAAGALRPRLNLAPDAPMRYADVDPFGVNVFLNEEVDPAKRELTVKLASEAGFHWLRQEFPWQDIEISGKGDFTDRRNGPAKSAWDKYDQIVALAEKYHMELIVRLSTPPSWSRARGEENGSFAPPDNFNDYGDFVAAVVSRYKGRIKFYQIWNEPNIYPEWGNYPINPEQYTELLKIGATRARQTDPNVVIICGALASTIALQPAAPPPTGGLNDLIFLQRMYDAGAAPYFDIMAMQAYGLWSGPTDRRMQPRVMNYGRPQYVRDLMVANGDANKPIWVSEMAWNAVPDDIPDKRFGQVTPTQQAAYAPLAYARAQHEWPWTGVINTWYFKRATDQWVRERKPEAYFRLADPDFTLQPVYNSLKAYMTAYKPTLYRGTHAPDAWAVKAEGAWQPVSAPAAPFKQVWQSVASGAKLTFTFEGRELRLSTECGGSASLVGAPCAQLGVTVDDHAPVIIDPSRPPAAGLLARVPFIGAHETSIPVLRVGDDGPHTAVIEVTAHDPATAGAAQPAGITAIVIR
jgi:polysaccharide biosynthesis protein PslG